MDDVQIKQKQTNQSNKVKELALIVGAGPGLGSALARCLGGDGMAVVVAARNAEKLDSLISELRSQGVSACSYGCDASEERSVTNLFNWIQKDFGVPDLVIYNVEHFIPGEVVDIEATAFEECWRAMCLGAFIVGKTAARLMLQKKKGTIIFSGATASTRGKDGYVNMAVGKFGIRALAQSMARELGPKGIHVIHTILDGGILSIKSRKGAKEMKTAMFPDKIAETYLYLHHQHSSTWTHEIDLRPWVEEF